MPSEVILPRVDMDMATGRIARWFVESGATVTKGQPLFEIETDKAAMEIEAPASGTIRDLAEASAAAIPVGSTVAWIFAAGEAAAPAVALEQPVEQPPHRAAAEPGGDEAVPLSADPGPRVRATPMARRRARLEGIDLSALRGSGPRGRIQAVDIVAKAQPAADERMSSVAEDRVARPANLVAAAVSTTVRAGPLNLVRLRDGVGRPTLLIHGFGGEANGWRPMLAGRAGAGPILALDLPGHGGSPLGTAGFDALVDAVDEHLRAADLGPLDVVGHSLGGAIAAGVAARGGFDLRSLLLIAPAGLGAGVNGAFVDGFLRATSEASLAPWMRDLVGDPALLSPAFVRATLKARQGTDLVACQRRIADAVFPDGTQAFSVRADLAAIRCPVRVIVGTADKVIPSNQVDGLPGRIAVHRFASVGHMPQIEIRDAVLAIMAEMAD